MVRFLAAGGVLLLAIGLVSGQKGQEVDYVHDVLPIFKAHCLPCHDAESQSGGLDLTKYADVKLQVKPGKPDDSNLLHRVLGKGNMPQMPMGFAPLGEAKIATIRTWIASGAIEEGKVKRTHWAYIKPVQTKPPVVKGTWAKSPIDSFVLAKLQTNKLSPSPEADRAVLLRRVSLDLTGLPPMPKEIESFLADRSPNAFEKVVDRLLASPHYGERQAQFWLDLARYADTHGYEADRSRTAYLYRDWVINAYNKNLPFDKFSIEQLAGDLLPDPSLESLVATGFHRNSMFNEEGGVDAEESMFETVLDRVGTTATVWMGSTLACARCHDHKFDPFTQEDFYRFGAYFANNQFEERGDPAVGQRKFYEPQITVLGNDQKAKLSTLQTELAKAKAAYDVSRKDIQGLFSEARSLKWTPVQPSSIKSQAGTVLARQIDGSYRAEGPVTPSDVYVLEVGNVKATGIQVEAIPDDAFPAKGPGRASSGNFILSKVELYVNDKPVNFVAAASRIQNGYSASGLSDDNPDTGWAVYPFQGKHSAIVLEAPREGRVRLELRFDSKTWPEHLLGRFRVSLTGNPAPSRFALTDEAWQLIQKDILLPKELETVTAELTRFSPERLKVDRLAAEIKTIQDMAPSAAVMRDKPTEGPLQMPLHNRGEFLNKGTLVTAMTPGFLSSASARPGNRLDLARWLVSPENPLAARVQVNRMWAQLFGRGLVETEEDFGTQGAKPTHPELLDWLAVEFVKSGWNVKAMFKRIVMSATYRQSSAGSKDSWAKDPSNELLSRGPRFRMDAEMIRDNALAASGLINRKIGGPSVFPYQPDGIWNSPYSGEAWREAKDETRYRRGLYVFWKRTSPYPSFMAFDATSRETCTPRRIRTNTPLQALALMNDPVMLEAAEALGSVMRKHGKTDQDHLREGFQRCTGRKPVEAEMNRLLKLVASLRAKKLDDPTVWRLVANTLLNLDETITKG
ncbi:MAG TPA: PSD1 and planctomycete cytochrome C domain-containing protein [Fimbriimonadaceae bacterium]|nr:PSD1 and planctomycete cytochrome C domain-containing protein [Fimbriimonadaceae bacterium]